MIAPIIGDPKKTKINLKPKYGERMSGQPIIYPTSLMLIVCEEIFKISPTMK